jgi:sulfite exporter TauE/SafE
VRLAGAFYLGILVASLLGSLHCAGMCGPFAAFATFKDARRGPWFLQALYHGGRLAAYVALGAIAGGLGGTLDVGASLLGLGRVAGALTGVLLVTLGLRRVLGLFGVRTPAFPGTATTFRLVGRLQARALGAAPVVRALGTGLGSALLPCGWLYAFVAVAAGAGHAATGALVMLAFWVGTVPILAVIGASVRQALARSGRWLQATTAVLVIALGVVGIIGRWNIVIPEARAAAAVVPPAEHRCH